MKVCVATVTYNQEAYIAQTIESVLGQECPFDVEMVIGEDCSTDRTREIVQEYADLYPGRIRLLLAEQNLGPQRNYVRVLEACDGDYIATLDGDDYWTASDKLATQVAFMEEHRDCTVCFHGVSVVRDDNSVARRHPPPGLSSFLGVGDVLRGNLIASCSLLFRRSAIPFPLPDWFHTVKVGDFPITVMAAAKGCVGYIDRTMAVYRQHGSGAWSGLEVSARWREHRAIMLLVDEMLCRSHHATIMRQLFLARLTAVYDLLGQQQPVLALRLALGLLASSKYRGEVSIREILRLIGACCKAMVLVLTRPRSNQPRSK